MARRQRDRADGCGTKQMTLENAVLQKAESLYGDYLTPECISMPVQSGPRWLCIMGIRTSCRCQEKVH